MSLIQRELCGKRQTLTYSGLDPSSDSKYYNFLLKLGVIRAATWGEKWDLFQSTQGRSPAFHSAPVRDTRSPQGSPGTPRDTRRIADKSRIPFLASASSDLDEGFEPSSDGRLLEGASIVLPARPSPRKAMRRQADRSRSLVGHTPSQSVDLAFDALSVNPPIRTSTPVYAQQPLYRNSAGRTSPGLPPYSVSDVSRAVDQSTSLMDEIDDPVTPRLKHNTELAPEVMAKWDSKTNLDMEALADNFYRLGLMGRCLDVWSQSNQWIQSTSSQIDRVRNTILLRQTMEKWRAACDLQLALPATADRHFKLSQERHALGVWLENTRVRGLERKRKNWENQKDEVQLRETWRKWRVEVVKRRTERWQKEVGKKERKFVAEKRHTLVADIFNVSTRVIPHSSVALTLKRWYGVMRDKVDREAADRFAVEHTQRQALRLWLQRARLSRSLSVVRQTRDRQDTAQTLNKWRTKARLAVAERTLQRTSDMAAVKSVWDIWRAKK